MTRPLDPAYLPDETRPRLKLLVAHSAPNPERPKLPEDTEKRLDPVERESAACYADMENETFRIHKLAAQIRGPG